MIKQTRKGVPQVPTSGILTPPLTMPGQLAAPGQVLSPELALLPGEIPEPAQIRGVRPMEPAPPLSEDPTSGLDVISSRRLRNVPSAPELLAPPVRDLAGEGSRGTQAALMGLAFGVGMGRGTAPALGAAAARGTSLGGDQLFQNQSRIVDATNKQKVADYGNKMDAWKGEVDAYNASTADKRLEILRAQADAERVADEKALEEREAARVEQDANRMGDDRTALITQLAGLAPDARQTALTLLESAGELNRRGITIPRDENGRWLVDDLAKALPASMSPEAQSIEQKKAARRAYQSTIDFYEQLVRDPRTDKNARTELIKRQGILKDAVAMGSDVPNWVYEISPGAIADMSPAQKESLRLRDEAIAASKERTQIMKTQGDRRLNQTDASQKETKRYHDELLKGKKTPGDQKTWEQHGIPSINTIDDDISRMIKDVADLRSGPIQKTDEGMYKLDAQGNPVRLKPSPENLAAANELVEQIKRYQLQQEQIAQSYGWVRDSANRRWVKGKVGK